MQNEERGDAVRHSQAPTPTLVSDGYPRAPPLQQAQSEGVFVYEFSDDQVQTRKHAHDCVSSVLFFCCMLVCALVCASVFLFLYDGINGAWWDRD